MYKEAKDFHKIALPAFIFLCVVLFLTGCDMDRTYIDKTTNNYVDVHDACNRVEGDGEYDLDDYSRVIVRNGKCTIEVNLGETNE